MEIDLQMQPTYNNEISINFFLQIIQSQGVIYDTSGDFCIIHFGKMQFIITVLTMTHDDIMLCLSRYNFH